MLSGIRTQPRQIFSNISGNAAGRYVHVARIRIVAAKGLLRSAVNVDIGAANHTDKRRVAQYVTATLDKPLVAEIHDVAGNGRTSDPQLRRYGLLRRHGIFPDECKNLLFAAGHIKHMLVKQTYVCN